MLWTQHQNFMDTFYFHTEMAPVVMWDAVEWWTENHTSDKIP